MSPWLVLLLIVVNGLVAIGFFVDSQPAAGVVWICYALSGLGWLAIALGYR